ncbi:MAG: ROK family protein [Actinomycetia bacterium]|nr:ROK family protein [Actinomycetes bacterium]
MALDVGGTKIAAGLVDRRGGVESLTTVATGSFGADSLRRAAAVADSVAADADAVGAEIVGVGIGVPELVEDGRITSEAVVGWTDQGVREAFSDFRPIRVEADIRAAALAEARSRTGAGAKVSLYINLGTGISHCLLIEGRPFEGQHGRALLSGSTVLTALDTRRNELVGSCVEDVASGRGISERYADLTGETLSAPQVFDLERRGDAQARLAVDQATELLGHLVATLIDILDPAEVIVGGGLCNVPGLVDRVAGVARRSVWSHRARATPIAPATLGPQAGVIGAGLTLLDRIR